MSDYCITYVNQVKHVNELILLTKTDYFKTRITSASSKDLSGTVKGLLNRSSNSLPVCENASDLARKFAVFFRSKIYIVSAELDT